MREALIAALCDAETKAWEALAGYKFWMFGYHAARWVNYNMLLPREARFRSPFAGLVQAAQLRVEQREGQMALLEISASTNGALPLLGSEGDGA
jgi:hypothetical protein